MIEIPLVCEQRKGLGGRSVGVWSEEGGYNEDYGGLGIGLIKGMGLDWRDYPANEELKNGWKWFLRVLKAFFVLFR